MQKPSKYYTLTEKGRPKVVMMSAEDFESWQETLEVRKDFPNLEKDIKRAREDYKKGDYVTLNDLLKKRSSLLSRNKSSRLQK
ncbi:type II toxin-antitoxin system Phd/YefM family antitoxin [Candidatus Azambacteria bacterium]|nr:type II toxin-antitoxin system Phd/YefM family antitoxin [Candidatus Azambacteria bacterium]